MSLKSWLLSGHIHARYIGKPIIVVKEYYESKVLAQRRLENYQEIFNEDNVVLHIEEVNLFEIYGGTL